MDGDPARAAAQTLVHAVTSSGVPLPTLQSLCATTGLTASEFQAWDQSLETVFYLVLDSLLEQHLQAVRTTLRRRRSLNESITAALLASWAVVEAEPATHRAAEYLLLELSRATVQSGTTDRTGPPAGVRRWLRSNEQRVTNMFEQVAVIHGATWTQPVPLLNLFLRATMHGLISDYLRSGDPTPARTIIPVIGYQLSQHGRRIPRPT